jgi:hypothetical protein
MHRRQSATPGHHSSPALVIVHDLNIIGISITPDEADAVPIVDPDAVLSTSVTRQRLQPIAREHCEVAELAGGMELLQLPLSHAGNPLQAAAGPPAEQRLGFRVLERPNHATSNL